MKKNTIGLLTGLAVAAVAAVGLLTRDQWMTGTPQPVAEPSTAKVAEPEAPATQAASGEAPAASGQTAAEGEATPPAKETTQAEAPATEQQPAVEAPAASAEAPTSAPGQSATQESASAEAPATETPAAPAEQPAATAEAPAPEVPAAQPEQQPAAPEQQIAATPAEPEPAAPAAPAETSAETSAETAAPSQDQAAVQPEAPAEPQQPAAPEQVPAFDTVRVEKTGEAVIAGTAEAGSEVVVKFDGEEIGKTTANGDGAFVLVPDEPLPAGSGELTIESKGKGDLEATPSEQSVAVIVPAGTDQGALVAVMSPDEPTKVLQTPEPKAEPEAAAAPAQPEAPAVAAEPQAASEPETQVAAAPQPEVQAPAQPQAAAPRRVSIDAVDYDSAGNIVFSGKGTPGLAARIYVDNKYIGDAMIDEDGRWSFSGTADIAPGVHSLRVDGLDADGKVASRIEVPFYREDQTVVAEAQPQPEPPAAEAGAPEAAASEPPQGEKGAAASAPVAEQPAAAAEATESSGGSGESGVPQKQDQETAAAQTEQQAASPQKPKEGRVVIQPGNNLWRISRVLYGSGGKYTMLYQANKDQIRNPDLIYPGQIFKTPEVAARIEIIDPKRREPLKPEENAASAP